MIFEEEAFSPPRDPLIPTYSISSHWVLPRQFRYLFALVKCGYLCWLRMNVSCPRIKIFLQALQVLSCSEQLGLLSLSGNCYWVRLAQDKLQSWKSINRECFATSCTYTCTALLLVCLQSSLKPVLVMQSSFHSAGFGWDYLLEKAYSVTTVPWIKTSIDLSRTSPSHSAFEFILLSPTLFQLRLLSLLLYPTSQQDAFHHIAAQVVLAAQFP